jgi:hypothetical protein
MHGSRRKIPSKNLVRQRCAEVFNSGVKGLIKYATHGNAAAESLRAMFVRDFLTVKTYLWTGPVCTDSYNLSGDL